MRILMIAQPISLLTRALRGNRYLVETAGLRDATDDKARSADLIVLDLDFAGRQGWALLKQWRNSGIDTLVLVLATCNAPEEKITPFDCGADALAMKPYDRVVVLAQVRALLRRTAEKKGERIRIFDLEIGISHRVVRRGGRTIDLTRREYDLLHFLGSNRGEIVTHAQIWAHLSGEVEESNSNVVAVFIRYLRQKIDKGFGVPLILTCWGRGYRLRGDFELN